MGTVTAPVSADEAMAMVHAGLGYLAAADPAAMAAGEQARLLRGLEQGDAIGTAARAAVLGAFTAGQGHAADAAYTARAWLIHHTGVTRGAAAGHVAWARDRKSTRLNSSHVEISYAVFCLKKKKKN